MDVWDIYENRMSVRGKTKRETVLGREQAMLRKRLEDSLSYHSVWIEGLSQDVAIINSDSLNEKTIISLPGDDIVLGSLVEWMDNYWLVAERDANTEVYTKAKMIQCNHLLKWVSDDGMIHEQWCVVEDGTKYMSGELEDRNFVTTRGDSRVAVLIARNDDTVKFNRDYRFLIDDPKSGRKLAYTASKPTKIGNVYNGHGVFKFVFQEVTSTGDDNHELGIADYYKYYPSEAPSSDDTGSSDEVVGKKRWL